MAPQLEAKKERNALIDFMKLIGCILAILAHVTSGFYPAFFGISSYISTMPGSVHDFQYMFGQKVHVLGIGAVAAISVFTFMTGYWFVDRFKRDQKKNLFGRGKDFELVTKYFFRNYSSYWPFLFFGTVFAIILIFTFVPQLSFFTKFFVNTVILALPNLIGIKNLGYALSGAPTVGLMWAPSMYELTENFTNFDVQVIQNFNSPLWYMFAILFFLPIWYIIFMKSEKVGLYVWTPLVFMLANITLSYPDGRAIWTKIGIDDSWIRLGGPMCWGVVGWYVVDWIKRTDFSKVGQRVYNIFAVVAFAFWLYIYGEGVGGFFMYDMANAFFMCFVIAQKDFLTRSFNKVLLKVPGKSLWGTMSVGIYLIHCPIIDCINAAKTIGFYPELCNFVESLGPDGCSLAFIGLMFVCMIPYYFIDKYFVKKLAKVIVKVSKCNEPVVFDEPAAK